MVRIFKNKTRLLITHRVSALRDVDTVLVIDDGALVQSGPLDELRHRDGPFRAMLAIEEAQRAHHHTTRPEAEYGEPAVEQTHS